MSLVAQPPIWRSAFIAWCDAVAAVGSMTSVAFAAFVLALMIEFAHAILFGVPAGQGGSEPTEMLRYLAVAALQGVVEVPLAIAVHRYVLLGEITGSYSLDFAHPRFRRFFAFAMALNMVWAIGLVASDAAAATGLEATTTLALCLALLAMIMAVTVRTLILFPAIAVDATGADWPNAVDDSKGHSWRIFCILVTTALPALVASLIMYALFGDPTDRSIPASVAYAVTIAAVNVLMVAAFAAAASRLFRVLAARLARA